MYPTSSGILCADELQGTFWLQNTKYLMWNNDGNDEIEVGEG